MTAAVRRSRMAARRSRARLHSGATLAEFALVAPIGFLLMLGALVLAVVVTNKVALTNGVRDAARGAAICGADTSPASTTALPDRSGLCTAANLNTYIRRTVPQITSINCPSSCITIRVVDTGGAQKFAGVIQPDSSSVANCIAPSASNAAGTPYSVEVDVSYQQPLYVPLIGYLVGAGGSNTLTITATAEAQCEQ